MQNKEIELIDIEYEITEQDKKSIYIPGMAKDMLIGGRDSGNVFIFSLNDELRKSVGAKVAEKLGREFVVINRSDGNPAVERVAAGNNQVVSMPRERPNQKKTVNC